MRLWTGRSSQDVASRVKLGSSERQRPREVNGGPNQSLVKQVSRRDGTGRHGKGMMGKVCRSKTDTFRTKSSRRTKGSHGLFVSPLDIGGDYAYHDEVSLAKVKVWLRRISLEKSGPGRWPLDVSRPYRARNGRSPLQSSPPEQWDWRVPGFKVSMPASRKSTLRLCRLHVRVGNVMMGLGSTK